jgi:tetratricopeptide (TPR) repeat protein
MIDADHPDPELLERYLDGDLPEPQAEDVSRAIDRRPAWRRALEDVRRNRELQSLLRATASTERHEAPLPEIPGLRILYELHRGGQGVVYAAVQESTGRRVALKLLLGGRLSSTIQRRRFEREVDLAASLTHPNIVKVFDRGDAPSGEPYYIMELVEGVPLDAYLRERDPAPRQRLELLRRVADAVSYAHQRAVMHRDLKPANILIDERDEPHVLDFGLAKPAEHAATLSPATEAGGFVGTLRYASPEQVKGDPDAVDVRTDVYSLGVILYESLAGRFPYPEGASLSALIRSISNDAPLRPRLANPRLAPDLETIILKAMEKDPARRYQSASELAADIHRFLRSEPITARPPTPAYQLRKLAERHKPLVGALAATFAVLLAALVAISASLVQTARARDAAQRRFDQVQSLARTFIHDIHDDIANLPGATRARERLVSTALEYLDSLAADAADDRGLALDLADAYNRVGDVQGNPDVPNLGDMPGALASYRKALDLYNAVLDDRPDDAAARRGSGLALEHTGNIQMYMGDSAEGVASFRAALATFERGAETDEPEVRFDFLRDVGALRMKLGRALIATGADAEARGAIRAGLELRADLAAGLPDRLDLQRELSQSQVSLGDELRYAGDLPGALERYLAAEAIRARIVGLQPGNATAMRDLAVVHNRIGNVHLDLEQYDLAQAAYERYHATCAALAEADPDNVAARRDLGVSLEKLADLRYETGRLDEAVEWFGRCIAVREALVAGFPETDRFQQDLSIALQLLGNVHMAADRPLEARTVYGRALEIRLPLLEADPANARLRNLVMGAHYKLATTHVAVAEHDASRSPGERRAEWRAAIDAWERSLAILRAMRDDGSLPPGNEALIEEIASEISRCREKIGADAASGPSGRG